MAKRSFLKNNSLIKFIKEAYAELRRVVWPKKSYVIKMTILVVLVIVISSALIGAFDYGMAKIIKLLL